MTGPNTILSYAYLAPIGITQNELYPCFDEDKHRNEPR